MHVGYRCYFQNPDGRLSDAEVDQQELRLAEVAEPLGFDSICSVEHHFDDSARPHLLPASPSLKLTAGEVGDQSRCAGHRRDEVTS